MVEASAPEFLEIRVEIGDITEISADVIALKYARSFHGADLAVSRRLIDAGESFARLQPQVGERVLVPSRGQISARQVLMVGAPALGDFRYAAIRDFASGALRFLAKEASATGWLAMTIHGPGYGLDEGEALRAQVAGYLDALSEGTVPEALHRISVVEKRESRAFRLWQALDGLLSERPDIQRASDGAWTLRVPRRKPRPSAPGPTGTATPPKTASSVGAGQASEARPHAFVAMPFTRQMDDVYYFGIEAPVHAAGLLCERVDQASFTGHILDQIRERIETASVVIADLTTANPNVYLEVGYAWGKDRPTILLVQDVNDLRFDVKSQKCLVYDRIIDLARLLSNELQHLHTRGLLRLPKP